MKRVEIRVKGQIAQDWSDWLGGLTVTATEIGETVLAGSVRDQASLHGVLDRLADLGLDLVSVDTTNTTAREQPEDSRPQPGGRRPTG